jgi:hypothetical protein
VDGLRDYPLRKLANEAQPQEDVAPRTLLVEIQSAERGMVAPEPLLIG